MGETAGGLAGPAAGVAAVSPALTVATEHARADVYRALEEDELATLAKLPDLPEIIAKALKGYVGRPFALVRLRTQPAPKPAPGQPGIAPQQHPGVRFHFTQEMRAVSIGHDYDYPLGTGQAWQHPIPLTRVYVTAPDDLPLDVIFPRYTYHPASGDSYQRHPRRRKGAANGRQVYVASYESANPDRDVTIRLDPPEWGPSRWIVQQSQRRIIVWSAWIGFPILGLFAWLVAFFAVIGRDRYANEIGLLRALWKSWLMAQAVLLVPLAVAMLVVLTLPTLAFWSAVSYLGAVVWVVIAVALTLTAMKFVAPDRRGFVWRSLGASVVAAVIYGPMGYALLQVLTS